MGRRMILPLVAGFSGLVAACAIPLLTPQQNSQYCEIEVQGPSGPPVFVQGTLLDPIAETSAEAFANASLVGLFVLGLVTRLPLLDLSGDPRAAVQAAHACDPARLVRPGAQLEFELVLRTADAQALARALKSALDAPRGKCASPRASRGHGTGPDGRLEIEEVSVVAGCLYGRMGYRVDVRWILRNAGSGDKVAATTTQCVLESFREVGDWLAHPDLARAEIEGAFAATGQRVGTDLVVGYPPAAQCRLGSDAEGRVNVR